MPPRPDTAALTVTVQRALLTGASKPEPSADHLAEPMAASWPSTFTSNNRGVRGVVPGEPLGDTLGDSRGSGLSAGELPGEPLSTSTPALRDSSNVVRDKGGARGG